MNPILKNILALLAGAVVGMIVNMGIITLGPSIIPLPEGVNPEDVESINANIHLYSFKDFIIPFLAHALGTLVGAMITAKIAAKSKMTLALIIGVFFLIGGFMMVMMLPNSPLWFKVLDLAGAYIPMAYLGARLVSK